MLPILTAHEMALADRAAIEELRTGESRLMELAGRETAKLIAGLFTRDSDLQGHAFLVVCGKGSNGGDGFVAARHLLNFGANVDVIMAWPDSELSGVNLEGLNILKAYRRYNERLRIGELAQASGIVHGATYDAIIDAVFGTGFRLDPTAGALAGNAREAVSLINTLSSGSESLTVSIDLPSGLDATTGRAATPCVRADHTITMAFLKTGFYQNEGPELCGEVQVAEISIPGFLVEPPSSMLVDEAFASENFLLREPAGAKHHNGKVLLIAGSAGNEGSSMLGAALLSAQAAVKTGAGYVCASLPDGQAAVMHAAAPEVVVIGRERAALLEKARWADTLVIGCGLGRSEETIALVESLLTDPEITAKKLVIDADALFAVAERGLLNDGIMAGDAVLTPHVGECSRLSGLNVEEIVGEPLETARKLSSAWNLNLLLKGRPTFIAAPAGTVLVADSGTEALATAGSGDVLAGMIGALAAKGVDTFEAAAAAAWIHGRAGDLASDVSSLVSASDVLQHIPKAIMEFFALE